MAGAPSDNLFITDLPEGTTDETLKSVFGSYGTVVSSKALKDGKTAMVRYSSVEEAQWVVDNVNGNIPQGITTPVQVKFAAPPPSFSPKGGKGAGAWDSGKGGGKSGWDGGKAGGWGGDNPNTQVQIDPEDLRGCRQRCDNGLVKPSHLPRR